MAYYKILLIMLILKNGSCKDGTGSLKHEAPTECKWTTKSVSSDDVILNCYIEENNFNFSGISSEHLTTLNTACDPNLNTILTIPDHSFIKINKIKDFFITDCKLKTWTNNILYGINDLRNLTINTYNNNNISLKFEQFSFIHVKLLEKLDLSFNNIEIVPQFMFCPLKNLVSLNLSYNLITDITILSFKFDDADDDDKEIINNNKKLKSDISNQVHCNLDIQNLDLSFNHLKILPSKSLKSLRRLHILNLNNNDITSIASSSLNGLKVLRTFDISTNRLTTLPSTLFKNCIEIREIKLQNNSLEVLPNEIFNGLEQLLILNLSKNRITSSSLNIFTGLIRLVLLDISFNRISTLNPTYFKDLYTLQILNLEHNFLEVLPSEAFTPLKNLHTLILSYNRLAILEPFSFNGLFALSLLSLDNNVLHTLHKDSLRNCTALQDLTLNGNMLKTIPLALQNMSLLRTVDLGENIIEQIDNPGFEDMNNLYGLRLIGNQIKNISKLALSKLPSLQILNLARNKINKIENGSFSLNKNLQAIRLDANVLTNITGLFNNVQSLIWLNVSDNLLTKFDYNLIPPDLQWLDLHKNKIKDIVIPKDKDFHKQYKLQTLDISYNKIKYLNSNLLPNNIELILLNDNIISTIDVNTFANKPNLTRVDLYSNQIIKMDLNSLRLSPISIDKKLPEFYIGSNPFYCDCSMEWLQRINSFSHLRQHPKVMDLESIYCKLPYSRDKIFIPLTETDSSNFVCEYKTHCFALCHCCDFDACDCKMTCPTNCTCYHDQSWSAANIVDCSEANFNQLPTRIPMDATEVYLDGNLFGELSSHSFIGRKNLRILYVNNSNVAAIHNHTFSGLKRLQIIHLENNHLKELHGFELQCLEEIHEIYLQNNQLIYIDNRTFTELKYLEIIRLDGNRLHNYPVWQFNLNLKLIKINLSDNNWSCNCQYVREFRAWLRNNIAKVIDSSKLTCVVRFQQSEDKSILKQLGPHLSDFNSTACSSFLIGVGYLDSNFNEYTRDYILLLLTILIAFIFAICIIFIVACQRKRLCKKSKCCCFNLCYTCKKTSTIVLEEMEPGFDKTRLYDAYISYSIKDDNFVNQILTTGLEPQYRLRLHYRDFSINSHIADTILEGVETSKRTILVLSQNFLSTEWKRFEFKSAIKEALQRDIKYKRDKNIKKLIIILFGDLQARDLDPDIRVYLNKTAICVKWGDGRFWEKLRYVMPEIRNRIHDKDTLKGSLYYCCKQSDDPSSSSAATSARSDTEYSAISTLPDCCDNFTPTAPPYLTRPGRGSVGRHQRHGWP